MGLFDFLRPRRGNWSVVDDGDAIWSPYYCPDDCVGKYERVIRSGMTADDADALATKLRARREAKK